MPKRRNVKHVYHHYEPLGQDIYSPYHQSVYPGYGGYGGSIATRYNIGAIVPYSRYHAVTEDPHLYRCMWDPEWNPGMCQNVFNFHSGYSFYSPFGTYW